MESISKQQIKSIYALGASLGLVEHGNHSHDDLLHQLVESITGNESISQISKDDANRVISELMQKMKGFPPAPAHRPSTKKYDETPGGMTAGQQRKVWGLMYDLKSFDAQSVESSLGTRLCGIIKRQFGMDASQKDPFRFLDYQQGRQLIEILKKYCTSAEMRKLRAGGSA